MTSTEEQLIKLIVATMDSSIPIIHDEVDVGMTFGGRVKLIIQEDSFAIETQSLVNWICKLSKLLNCVQTISKLYLNYI